jgi:hypothetical protein
MCSFRSDPNHRPVSAPSSLPSSLSDISRPPAAPVTDVGSTYDRHAVRARCPVWRRRAGRASRDRRPSMHMHAHILLLRARACWFREVTANGARTHAARARVRINKYKWVITSWNYRRRRPAAAALSFTYFTGGRTPYLTNLMDRAGRRLVKQALKLTRSSWNLGKGGVMTE